MIGLVVLLVMGTSYSFGRSSWPASLLNNERGSETTLDDASSTGTFKRVSIKIKEPSKKKEIDGLALDVRHQFPDGTFTAHVPASLLSRLQALADVEEVPVFQLTHHDGELMAAKPVCGNGIAEKSEKCGEPGLSCPVGETCANCKCGATTPPPSSRVCFPSQQREYNVTQINGGLAGNGAGINVAVLDTGIDTDHPDLMANITLCKDATKRGIQNGCEDKDSVGHGTHSSGIIAASGGADGLGLFGVAPAVSLQIIKVCGGGGCFGDDIAAAIDYVAGQGAQVINMSFGGNSESSLIRDAIARHPDTLFVASAGNDGPAPGSIDYPAANSNVVAVAAHDTNLMVASFSSRGITDGDDGTLSSREIEFSAGGVQVESTNKGGCYSKLSGTSFSSPTIAGLAARLWTAAGGTASTVRSYLRTIVTDITTANGSGAGIGYDIASGYGIPVAP